MLSASRASGGPASRAPTPRGARRAPRRGGPSRRDADLPQRLPPRLGDHTADRRGAVTVRVVRRSIVREVPEIRDIVVGNEPNLNRSGCRSSTSPVTTWLRRPTSRFCRRRTTPPRRPMRTSRSGAAPWRREGSTGPARVATRTRRRRSSATSARPTRRVAARSRLSTGSPSIRIRRARAFRPTGRPTPPRSRSCSPTTRRSWPAAQGSVRPACRSSTASSAWRPRFRPRRHRSTRARNRESRSTRRRQADYYRRAIKLGFVPGGRRRVAALPFPRRTGAHRLPVRRLLRRRDAEDEPRARAQGDRSRGVASAYDVSVSTPSQGQYVAYTLLTSSTPPGAACRSTSAPR